MMSFPSAPVHGGQQETEDPGVRGAWMTRWELGLGDSRVCWTFGFLCCGCALDRALPCSPARSLLLSPGERT